MNILLIGPQGSGKGTQARFLADKFGFFYFETGDFLRNLAKTNPVVKEIIECGKLVPNKEMSSYVQSYFDKKGVYDQIIFDGFPRTVEQYDFFKKWLKGKEVNIDLVIVLEINEETSIKRLEARRLDPKTGMIYNLITDMPPKGVSLKSLIQREDDKPDAIKERLKLYRKRTLPLIKKLEKDTKVVKINGEEHIEKIREEIERIVNNEKSND